ncbi:hypothetical protein FIA58_004330 [Flavobacterium jejuense]|uniref:Uncharacterized protein n=1 Tax=Flavobacterium jejuense TaxID=1544455 RepID=A0ABX0IPP3_9FLAO|nr:hypothetical protein [Flavobacterium jejuense]NHN24897.1 hypothetical protein [Flavobacterium jejuense]
MRYNKHNFHKHTFCEFQEVNASDIENLKLNFKSKSGSSYYFTEKGLYRLSNHWGRAANCRWRLKPISSSKTNNSDAKIGYANWTDFYPNNDKEKLFYVEVNWITNEVIFQHKNNPNFQEHFMVRDALATAKRIQIIREVLLETNWSKYLTFTDLEVLRKEIVTLLLTTDETFIKIKQNFNQNGTKK